MNTHEQAKDILMTAYGLAYHAQVNDLEVVA